jgi:hypothetical protein
MSQPAPAYADKAKPPPVVPTNIHVPAGNKAFLEGDAIGTQDYICLPSGWTFFGPQATLFNEYDEQMLKVVGAQDGPTGGDELSETTYIQRLNSGRRIETETRYF